VQTVPDKISVIEEGGVAGPAFVTPKWRKPAPLGYGNAIDSVGTVGSSLLAGFSLASVIIVTSAAEQFRCSVTPRDASDTNPRSTVNGQVVLIRKPVLDTTGFRRLSDSG
jgi:hypothetical protein